MIMTAIRPGAIGTPGYSRTMPCDRASVALARRLVQAALLAWGLPILVEDAVLIVSELATNAVQHGKCHHFNVRISLHVDGSRVRLTLSDQSTERPLMRKPTDGSQTGRGLLLIDALADTWGTDFSRAGKEVWAELSVPGT